MILSFVIQNFKSILDITLNTSYNEGKAPNRYRELENYVFLEEGDKRVSPILSIFGANASGKSNIIEAFDCFQSIVTDGLEYVDFQPNRLNREYENTKFAINLITNNKEFFYTLVYNNESIIEEELKCNKDLLYSCSDKKLLNFSKEGLFYNKQKVADIYNVECKDENQNQQFTLLSKLSKNYANLDADITAIYNYIAKYVEICRRNDFYLPYTGIKRLTEELGDEQLALSKITKIIKNFDIDIESIEIEHKKTSLEDLRDADWPDVIHIDKKNNFADYNKIYSYHKNTNNELIRFGIREESDGTQILFSLVGIALATLEKGGVLIVDELDRSIHPLLLIQFVRLFKDKRYNRKNAQLIFTLHAAELLEDDLIRKSEIAIVSKTKKIGSTIKRLSEFKDLRNALDFRKRYLQGEFQGIPQAYI